MPIGISGKPFSGTFEGGGHKITGLYIDTTENYQGLFGYVEWDGTVKNLGVGGTVTGGDRTGGVVGQSRGTVTSCYNTGTVTATKSTAAVGGGLGANDGHILLCYYLDTSCSKGGSNALDVTKEQFASGEVAWNLQRFQAERVWGQGLRGIKHPYPQLRNKDFMVYKVAFMVDGEEYAAAYTNRTGHGLPAR